MPANCRQSSAPAVHSRPAWYPRRKTQIFWQRIDRKAGPFVFLSPAYKRRIFPPFLPAANNIPSAFFRSLFHLPRPAPRGSRYTNNFPLQSAPSRFQRSIFDEYTVFPVQLSKNMPFFQPIAQRFSFCLHSGMRFFVRMMQHKCSSTRFSDVKLINYGFVFSFPFSKTLCLLLSFRPKLCFVVCAGKIALLSPIKTLG